MADRTVSTPRSTANRHAATTPHRRSQLELLDQLNSLFDSLDPSSPSASRPTSPLLPDGSFSLSSPNDPQAPRTAPLRLVPRLLEVFEQKRGVQLLTFEEKVQLKGLVEGLPEGMENQPVGVEQLFDLLVGLGVTTSATGEAVGPALSAATPSMDAVAASLASPAPESTTTTPNGPPPVCRTPLATASMLRPDAGSYRTGDGSPVARHRRTGSAASASASSSARTSATPSPIPGGSSSHIPVSVSRRRTIPGSPFRAAAQAGEGTAEGSRLLRRMRTREELARLAENPEDGYSSTVRELPSGSTEREAALAVAKQARVLLLGSKGPSREADLAALLAPLTPSQLEVMDQAFAAEGPDDPKQRGGSLLDMITTDRSIKGSPEHVLRGLLKGPLAWDVYLLQKALDAPTTNDALVFDILVGRSPAALAALRTAYAERAPDSASGPRLSSNRPSAVASPAATGSPAAKPSPRSLDVAVLSAYSSNTRLRKAWEIALKGRWEDVPALASSAEEREEAALGAGTAEAPEEWRSKLLAEDVDQLKVALRRGGSSEIVAKILLARSPVHVRKICEEYALLTGGNSTLTRAIKQSVPAGTLQRLFLHAVEGAKHVSESTDYGVWRDAKALARLLETEKGPRRDELLTRLVRLHWNPARFRQVQAAFEVKYGRRLSDRLRATLPAGPVCDMAQSLLASVDAVPPAPPPEPRLAPKPTTTSQKLSADDRESPAQREVPPEVVSDPEPAELEAEGELSDPPSPRSPPVTEGHEEEIRPYTDDEREEHRSSVAELKRSTSSVSSRSEASFDRPRSASSSRSHSSPSHGHRPGSSAGGSADTSRLSSSLRHSRPMAPSRAKRRQSEEAARSQRGARGASEEPLSPRQQAVYSPTLSHSSRGSLSRSGSAATIESSLSTSMASHGTADSSIQAGLDESGHTIDTSSFVAGPLSPVQDHEIRPSSAFFPDNHSSTPPPASPPPFDPVHNFFAEVTGTPDSPERFFSGLMRRDASQTSSAGGAGSRPSSLFGDGMLDSLMGSPQGFGGDGLATIRGSDQFQQLLRHANDLTRKLKDNESRFHANASQYESEVSDLEGQLEEARSELHAKRREEKELRSVEQEHVQQISTLEGEVAKLNKSLERSREAYETMKRNYTATCDEAERLRGLVADLRRDNRSAEEAIQGHSLQVQQFERDRELLQQAISKLEGELETARQAEDALDDQKQENLLLKETIDKLRFEIEEMRSVGPRSGFLDAANSALSPSKSLADSISKSIGREIATRMAAGEEDESEEDEASETEGDGADDVDDIIVTTHRRIKKRGKRSYPLSEPQVRLATTVNMADADCQTPSVAQAEMQVQTELSAVGSELAKVEDIQTETPPPPPPPKSAQEMQAELATQLGVDVQLIKQLANGEKPQASLLSSATDSFVRDPIVPSRRSSRWRSRLASVPTAKAPMYLVNVFPISARPYVAQLLDSGLSLVLYTATIYLVGVLSGSRFVPVHHRHYFSPSDLGFSTYDTPRWEGFAAGAGADGGFAPEGFARILYETLWSGVRTTRRVPI
ncbi:hypothetical protein JCM8202_000149 [Rhodotorula sphaerocarpa]